MVFGHAAAASLLQQTWLRRVSLPLCLAAAYGPDWIDKPLKLCFGLAGHGFAHSLIGSLAVLALVWFLCRRADLPDQVPAVVAFFWVLHLLCDWVHATVLFWPFFGPFPATPLSTATLARDFYLSWPLGPLAWCDVALSALALAARAAGRPALVRFPGSCGKKRPFIDTKPFRGL